MSRHIRRFIAVLLLSLTIALPACLGVAAQSATPSPAGDEGDVVAGGLAFPRGFAWDESGTLHVALAGSGGDTGSVVMIDNVCPVVVASGLPSTRGMDGAAQGPSAVAFLDGQLYVLQDGSYMDADVPAVVNGVYAAEVDGTFRLVADISSWIVANPVANIPYDYSGAGETFTMVAGDGFLWVLESNSGQVLRVTTAGEITRVVDLSAGHPVPAGLALAPDGGVYVGFLTAAPYTDGSSKVVAISPEGTVTDVWTGLTAITALAVDGEGTLYALELATGNLDQAPFLQPDTGKVVRQTGPTTAADVVTGLDYPVAMAFGPDDALYIGLPAFSPDNEPGGIVRLNPSAASPLTIDPAILSKSPCPAPPVADFGTPEARC